MFHINSAAYDWQEYGSCADKVDDVMFYPEARNDDPDVYQPTPEPGKRSNIQKARALCGACPVKRECLFMSLGERYGIWAGHGYKGRSPLRRQAFPGHTLESVLVLTKKAMEEADGDIDEVIINNPRLANVPGLGIGPNWKVVERNG